MGTKLELDVRNEENKLLANNTNELLNKIMEILEKDDGKSFVEKKEECLSLLRGREDAVLEEHVIKVAIEDEIGKQIKDKFWSCGEKITCSDNIVLRKPIDDDKKGFISIQKEYSPMRGSLVEEIYCDWMWKDHIECKALMCTIVKNGEYIGYCGIKNTGKVDWEIAIELLSKWVHKGIGYIALSAFLKEIGERLEKNEFRVRITPDNYASQKLFEKMGAKPNGISEFMIHDKESIEHLEEENLHLIDERLMVLAEQFEVEPRQLLSHVLEYKLVL